MKKLHDGYILVLSVVIMSLLIIISTQIYYLSFNFSSYSHFALKREKAKMLALSGVQLVRERFYFPPQEENKEKVQQTAKTEVKEKSEESKEKKQEEKKPSKPEPKKSDKELGALLARALPILNRWQSTKLTIEKDGVEGEIKTYVACEDGKIHLNNLLSLMAQKGLSEERVNMFKALWQKIGELVKANKNLYESALEFFDRRNRIWLNDISEILDAPGFQVFNDKLFVFLTNGNKDGVYLMDLFTPQSRYAKLDPWVLSASVQKLLGLKSKKMDEGAVAAIVKDFQSSHNWRNDWNKLLKPIYGKDFEGLPKGIDLMLSVRFDPAAFSVVSYGVVDGVKQGVFTILVKQLQPDGSVLFIPIKTYWIN
ncbi:TPA: hypothetical protein DIC20_01290 [Candidatus Dependentiae bacterium]|nr:MAG: hypothetical protein US03_C0002G0134 [candidate division TM6 bacterium GW2011_GWF2_36_131]KKQ03567.1 MAG: hypothetical protein US13_C0002G0133 [candidate division TM6 bacterium GW2011_GWE2_36_25]KKQ20157.1 MAG: hypothetical protein US32_C0001G0054 [candidate division TM6 bacterium GW2011_GWA2_36_9]HBR70699.1 hypothetical protein [Candidatus Dependentiae bacterium]HCU00319.1 hypothetical protein [Candidatus Dependentiae bacterium]